MTPKTQEAVLDYAKIASALDVEVKTVRQWKVRNLMPEPDMMVGQSPAWKASTLDAFFRHYRTHGRPGFQRA
jgi:hypothetical protein